MEIQVKSGEITTFAAKAIVVGCFEGAQRLEGDLAKIDHALGGTIARLIGEGETRGKINEHTLVHTLGKLPAERVLVIGLGKPAELTVDRVRCAIAGAARFLRQKGTDDFAAPLLGSGVNNITPENSAQALTEGGMLGLYTFRSHITSQEEAPGKIKKMALVTGEQTASEIGPIVARARILAEAAIAARDMVNEPANFVTPTAMAEKASELAAAYGLQLEVFDRPQMESMGMGGLLGVAQGSHQPPKFIVMHYKGRPAGEIDLALVGKGITFDSGGISIKPSEKMDAMKGDKAGGTAVMYALAAIGQLKPALNVSSIIPATENMPGGAAFRPGDILKALNGKTMEIISTDAEGRLVLADALSYAHKIGAKAIVDVATLTGSCVVALGDICTGAFANDRALMEKMAAAAGRTGKRVWQMPMFDEYRDQIKSDVADIKNSGGRYAGASTAAKFLAEFVSDTPWVHLDIAGTSMLEKGRGYEVKGATGVPLRTLVTLALSMSGQ